MNIPLTMFRLRNQVMGILAPLQTARKARGIFMKPRRHQPKDWELEVEKQGQRIAIGEGLSAIQWGTGPCILLMHGWESRGTQLAKFVEPLTRQGFQVVALDAPAHGHSLGEEANPVVFAEAILTVEKELGPFYAVIGHSMGAAATAISLKRGLECQKVVLISGPSSIEQVLLRFAKFIGLSKGVRRRFIRVVENHVGLLSQELEVAKMSESFEMKALIIHDHDDLEVPFSEAESIQRHWKNAVLIPTNGLGHRRIVRDPIVLERVVAFMKDAA